MKTTRRVAATPELRVDAAEKSFDFSVVVPCYNEKGAVDPILRLLAEQLAGVGTFEVLVVDDGSTDGTGEILDRIQKDQPCMRVIRHARNGGYGAALKTGIVAARGRYVAITDADGTYPNGRLPELLDVARGGVDMVVGARIGDGVNYSKLRAFPKLFMRLYCEWITRRPIPDMNSGLRVFNRDTVLRYLSYLPDSFSFTTTVTIAMMTNHHRVEYIPISYETRIGNSKISPIKDTIRFSQLILRTALYFAPLRVFGPVLMALWGIFAVMLGYDFFYRGHMADRTLVVFSVSLNAAILALIADMIDKRLS